MDLGGTTYLDGPHDLNVPGLFEATPLRLENGLAKFEESPQIIGFRKLELYH